MTMRLIAIGAALLIILTVLFTDFGKSKGRYYDCRLSEISPDFPTEVREQCRKLRLEQYKKNKSTYI
jgi:hypothetical protein